MEGWRRWRSLGGRRAKTSFYEKNKPIPSTSIGLLMEGDYTHVRRLFAKKDPDLQEVDTFRIHRPA
jgi:hypothetical protein